MEIIYGLIVMMVLNEELYKDVATEGQVLNLYFRAAREAHEALRIEIFRMDDRKILQFLKSEENTWVTIRKIPKKIGGTAFAGTLTDEGRLEGQKLAQWWLDTTSRDQITSILATVLHCRLKDPHTDNL